MSHHAAEIIFEDSKHPEAKRRLLLGPNDMITVGNDQRCRESIKIFRESSTHVRLHLRNDLVSRKHLQFYSVSFEADGAHMPLIYVRNLGSANDTIVEGDEPLLRLETGTWRLLQHEVTVLICPRYSFTLHENIQAANFAMPENLRKQVQYLAKDYHLLRTIANGSQGNSIYLAQLAKAEKSSQVGKKVVCKVTRLSGEAFHLESLEREATLHSYLDNPYIVPFRKAYCTENYFFIVTELACGGDLFSLLAREGPLPERLVRCYMRQIVSGIRYLHKKEIIHADIKPDNILIMDVPERGLDHRLVVSDFGAAVPLSAPTSQRTKQCGTPGYLSPEMTGMEKPYGPEVDVWGIGLLAIHMLLGTGGPLEPGVATPAATPEKLRIILDTVDDIRENNGQQSMSRAARDFISQCLRVSAKERPTVHHIATLQWLNGSLEGQFKNLERAIMEEWEPRPHPDPVIKRFAPLSTSVATRDRISQGDQQTSTKRPDQANQGKKRRKGDPE